MCPKWNWQGSSKKMTWPVLPVRDFNHLDVCWESSTIGCKQSSTLLECIEDYFLVQILDKPEEKCCWTWCSSVRICLLKSLRLEAVWDKETMSLLSLWSWGMCVWQKAKSGLWLSGEWNSNCLRTYWMRFPGELSLGTKEWMQSCQLL